MILELGESRSGWLRFVTPVLVTVMDFHLREMRVSLRKRPAQESRVFQSPRCICAISLFNVFRVWTLAGLMIAMLGCFKSSTPSVSSEVDSDFPRPSVSKAGCRLSISPESLDLGEIWVNQSHEVRFAVSNVSDEQINVVQAISSCSCTNLEPDRFSLNVGASTEIVMTLDLSGSPSAFSFENELVVDLAFVDERGLYERYTVEARIQRPFLFPEGIPSLDGLGELTNRNQFKMLVQSHPDVTSVACETTSRLAVVSSEDVHPGCKQFTLELRDAGVLGRVSETVTLIAGVGDKEIREEVVVHGDVTGAID